MGIEKIRDKILKDAEIEAKRITSEARQEAGFALRKAALALEEKEKARLKKGLELAAQEKQKITSQASLEAKKEKMTLQTKAIDAIIDGAREKLGQAGKNKRYAETLERLAIVASKELEGAVSIEIRKNDAKLLNPKKIGEKAGKKIEIKNTLGTTGLIASNPLGARIDCTLASILKEKDGPLRAELLEALNE